MIGPHLRAFGRMSLMTFALIALTTPNWLAGPLTWWPMARIESASRGTVTIGGVYALPVVAFGLWALGVGLTRQGLSGVVARLKRAWPMSVLVLMLAAWLLVRVRWDLSRAEAILASSALLVWGMMYLVVVGEAIDVHFVITLLVIAAGVHALVGLGQFARQSDLGWQILGEERLDPIRGGITVIEAESQRILRAYGLARHPNTVGGVLAVGALAAVGAWLMASPHRHQRWFNLAALALITTGLIVTFSRSAWLGAFSGGLMGVWASRLVQRRRWPVYVTHPLIMAFGLVGLIAGCFLLTHPELFSARFLGGLSAQFRLEQGSLIARARSLQTAWLLIQQAPLLGVGVRGYLVTAAHLTGQPLAQLELAHNAPLLLWAEAGLGAAGLWLGLWGVMVGGIGWRHRRGLPIAPGQMLALAWMTCVQVANQFNYYAAPAQNLQAPVMLGLMCGVWAVSSVSPASTDKPGGPADSAD